MNLKERNERIIQICVAKMNAAPDAVCARLARENISDIRGQMQSALDRANSDIERCGTDDRASLGAALMAKNDAAQALERFDRETAEIRQMDEATLAMWWRSNNLLYMVESEGKVDADLDMDLLKRSGYAARVLCNILAETE